MFFRFHDHEWQFKDHLISHQFLYVHWQQMYTITNPITKTFEIDMNQKERDNTTEYNTKKTYLFILFF